MKHCRRARQLRLTSDICGWLPGQNQHSSALQCSDPWCNAMLVWTAVQCCKLSASWSSWPRRDPRMLLSALEPFPSDQSLRSFSQNQSFLWDTIIAIISYWSIISFSQSFWVGKICQSLLGTFLPEKFFLQEGRNGGEAKESSRIWSLYSRLASIHNVFMCLGCIEVKTHLWCSPQPGTAKWPWISSKVCSTWHQWFSAIQPLQFFSLQ